MERFEGTKDYIATDDLKVAVNAAVTLRRPLLVKGEPGTGKTVLAHEIAKAVDAPLIETAELRARPATAVHVRLIAIECRVRAMHSRRSRCRQRHSRRVCTR